MGKKEKIGGKRKNGKKEKKGKMGERKKMGKKNFGKQKKNKKIHELQLRFSYRLFGMPAEANFGAHWPIYGDHELPRWRTKSHGFRQNLKIALMIFKNSPDDLNF